MILLLVLIIEQHALRRAFEVVELPSPHGPEKARESKQAEAKGDGDEKHEPVQRAPRARRRELPTTISELKDIASAAMSGVTSPATANGTAMRL